MNAQGAVALSQRYYRQAIQFYNGWRNEMMSTGVEPGTAQIAMVSGAMSAVAKICAVLMPAIHPDVQGEGASALSAFYMKQMVDCELGLRKAQSIVLTDEQKARIVKDYLELEQTWEKEIFNV